MQITPEVQRLLSRPDVINLLAHFGPMTEEDTKTFIKALEKYAEGLTREEK